MPYGFFVEQSIDECEEAKVNPCLNEGRCNQNPTPPGYHCACADGYTGKNCEIGKNCFSFIRIQYGLKMYI